MAQPSAQKKATIVATLTATALAFIKLIIAIASGSVALLASAIDSVLDVAMSLFNFFAIKKSEEAPTKAYPYGKGKIQAIAAVIEGTLIIASGIVVLYSGAQKLLHHQTTSMLTPAIIAMVISIVVTFILVSYLRAVAKSTNSLVLKSDALHYQSDLYSNAVVLIALFLVYLTGIESIDALLGMAIGFYIIYSAYEIIQEGVVILLDKALPKEQVKQIEAIIKAHKEVQSFHWLRTRTDSVINFVEVHLVLQPNMILAEAHRIADELEDAITAIDSDRKWAITPHFDPYDDEETNKALLFGNQNH